MNEKIKRKAHVKQSFSLDFLERGTFTEYPYVAKLCSDPDLLEQFNEQLKRTVPYKRNTEYYFTAISSYYGERKKINTFSGITISDPSTSAAASKKNETAWYVATH